MDKSMYSLILMDDVVRAVDRLAYESGTSRSNLINRILADYVSLLTPEKRIQQIFQSATGATSGNTALQVVGQPSGSLLTIKSVVNYKYNPTIRYSVEISAGGGGYTGEFRVMSRSQSDSLLDYLTDFFLLWSQVEQALMSERLPRESLQHEVGGGRFCRRLSVLNEGEIYESEQLGETIGQYIDLFDRAMNLYFTGAHDHGDKVIRQIMELYQGFVEGREIVI